jgi:hypothetical protein
MRASVERTGIIATSSLMEEDGVTNEQPITGLGELQVGGGLFCRQTKTQGVLAVDFTDLAGPSVGQVRERGQE